MRQDSITKIYTGLDSKELATLAFSYLTDENELEFRRVAAAVPIKSYQCPDMEYQDFLDGFIKMAALWAIEHWYIYSRSLEALVAMHMAAGNQSKEESMIEVHRVWESRLLALESALSVVCEENGISPDAVRRLARTTAFTSGYAGLMPDDIYRAEFQVKMAQLLAER